MPRILKVQITFDRTHETFGAFRDAIYVPYEDYGSMTEEEISGLEDARFDAWVSQMETPPVPGGVSRKFTRTDFRALFTLDELIACDNYELQPLPDLAKAQMRTIVKSFELSDRIDVDNPQVIQAMGAIESFGLIAPGRAAEILASTPTPPTGGGI